MQRGSRRGGCVTADHAHRAGSHDIGRGADQRQRDRRGSSREHPDGSTIAKAIDYSLDRWTGLGQFLLDGDVPIDHCENRIRPVVLTKKNSLFVGSQLAGERAAVVMSLLHSARLNGHEPWAYLKDVLTRLPTQLNSRIEELLPHRWQPQG